MDTKARAEYDRGLLRARGSKFGISAPAVDGHQYGVNGNSNADADGKLNGEEDFKTGVEVADLDELEENEEGGLWWRSCRCGQEKGFVVGERDLEESCREGLDEVWVGCQGCSLWLRVLFGVVEEEGEGG